MYSADRARLTSASDDPHSANVTKERVHTKVYIQKESDPPCTIPHLPKVAAVRQAAVSLEELLPAMAYRLSQV